MEVILKEDVQKLGHRGDVVKVTDGYGRNFLLPRKLAIEATTGNRAVIEEMKAAAQRRSVREKADAEGDPDEKAPRQTGRASLEAEVEPLREEWDADEPEHLHPEDDEQESADALEPDDHLAGERADERDRDPQEREHGREPDDEGERVRDRACPLRPRERRLAGHVDKECGHERKHAWREEREHPRAERDGDVHSERSLA